MDCSSLLPCSNYNTTTTTNNNPNNNDGVSNNDNSERKEDADLQEQFQDLNVNTTEQFCDSLDRNDIGKPRVGKSTWKLNSSDALGILHPENKHVLPEWKDLDSSIVGSVNVRSKFYMENQVKYPSTCTLYECVGFDVIDSDQRIPNVKDQVHFVPSNPMSSIDDDFFHLNITAPYYFVVSVSIPKEAPKLRPKPSEEENGVTSTMVLFLKMRDITRRVLTKLYSDTKLHITTDDFSDEETKILPAVKLWEQWCKVSAEDSAYSGRFKVIGSSPNAENMLPKAMAKYNGKPFLIKRTGITGIHCSKSELKFDEKICSIREFDLNLHAFPYIAKQAFSYANRSLVENLVMRLSFLIEGRDEEELPEVLLGGVESIVFDRTKVMNSTQFFENE